MPGHVSSCRALGVALAGAFLLALAMPAVTAAQGSDAEARAVFNAGEVAYSEGRYDAALEYFNRAYELSHRALLLYNIGSAAEHLRRDAEALAAFERYLAETPEDAPNRVAVAARIEFLRRAASTSATPTETDGSETGDTTSDAAADTETDTGDDASAAAPPADEGAAASPPADGGPGVAPWIVLGIGGAVAIAGAVLVGVGFGDAATVSGAADGTMWSTVSGAYDRAPMLEGVGFALLGVGVAAAVAGVIWGVAGSGGQSQASVSAWVTPDGAGVTAGGRL